ncbi:L-serine dehydratase, iron-sulfur-dependent subunit beta [Ammoniphilus oxalaticus]|uniref:L-serine deaminase n=1 Tax=Ammoniphilus oxalaticus TaxID=66863 RepID=A0A419SJK8_9BACL|nr:L-serine ammonia-lyase, iron-sulfur-dependent subunit beta [Ammoniphilus oxalaticus]RKD24155.1 L-serine dehydratase, iron-sulfur-dependent subunit beta [Ammoniphilus oxalaticus]
MKYRSVFDIIGPIMIGPSSSHTAGAARIGLMSRNVFGRQPKKAEITFLGSFAQTYKGHGTDIAIIGGILGLNTYDERMVEAHQLAKELGVEIKMSVSDDEPNHPNTAIITLSDEQGETTVEGISIGGGKIVITSINGFTSRISGEVPTILVKHQDRSGVVASITEVFAERDLNIAYLELARKSKGGQALMIIETDYPMDKALCKQIESLPFIEKVVRLETI